jgi:hypothetical protein
MGKLLALLFILSSCSPAFKTKAYRELASEKAARENQHAEAAEEFKNLHFFEKGRGMMISPGLIELYGKTGKAVKEVLIEKGFGLNVVDGEAMGLLETEYLGHKVGVLGCVACHSGKAAGQYIMGLGNKNIDVWQIGNMTLKASQGWKLFNKRKMASNEKYRALTEDALIFAKTLSNKSYSNLTQGLVPTGVIRTWFYRQAGLPIPEDLPRAAVKVPHMWGFAKKRQAGVLADGGGNGKLPGWIVAVELVANQKPEVIRSYIPRMERTIDIFESFLPPKYPFAVERNLAHQGKEIFEMTCAKCHGTYERDETDLPIFKTPKWIPIKVVKTDPDRLGSINKSFLELVRNNPLKDILIDEYKGDGYFAPRLEGVWARFPYLHNASVPTVRDLLKPASERPKVFSLVNAGEKDRFDSKNLGLKLSRKERAGKKKRHRRSDYDTSLEGQSNKGHEFHTDLAEDQKEKLIEYLKTL